MDKWEYQAVYIQLKELKDSKGKKYASWVVEYGDGTRIEGLDVVLNSYGSHGWELVNLVTEDSRDNGINGGASTYGFRAIFKRQVQ